MNSKININKIRLEFEILNKKINNNNLIYVDNAATTQKPKCVIEKLINYYKNYNSNIHRGAHTLATQATNEYEKTREIISNFIGSKNQKNIIFTKGTTDSINLFAFGLEDEINEGDEIVLSVSEHHANLVPWQEIVKKKKAKLRFIPINSDFEIDLNKAKEIITKKTKIVSIAYISNVLGSINNIEKLIEISKKNSNLNAIVHIDCAQSIAHKEINVDKLNVDAVSFSSHKMYGPTGVGVLYVNDLIINKLKPRIFGGDMIEEVFLENSTYTNPPHKFEGGTPNIADVIAFGEAVKFIEKIGIKNIEVYEKKLTEYFLEKFLKLTNFNLIGKKISKNRTGVFSFTHNKIHSHDITTILDKFGIATRGGHHCAMPLMNYYNINSTTRISLAFYNTKEEIDKIIKILENIEVYFRKGLSL